MGLRIGLVLALAAVTVACGGNVERERLNLFGRDREFSNAKDLEKVLPFYAPDASLYLPEMPVARGAANIRAAVMKFAAAPGFSIDWQPTQAGVSASGDLGFTAGTYRIMSEGPDARHTIAGEYVEVWKKGHEVWQITEQIFHPSPN